MERIAELCLEENIPTAIFLFGIVTFDIVHMQMTDSAGHPMSFGAVCRANLCFAKE